MLTSIRAARAPVSVIGAGYVGLAVAVEAARAGFEVSCVDMDADRVEMINRGRSYIEDVTDESLHELVATGRFTASTSFDVLEESRIAIMSVPTPLTRYKEPDLSFVVAATRAVAEHLRPESLVILESTTYPGTTSEIVQPILESTGLGVGSGFWLAFSPERIDPGNKAYTFRMTPKIVGGVDPESTEVAAAFYEQLVDQVVPVSSAEAAEMVKIYENCFRNVNIAFANEVAQLCHRMGISSWEVIDAAATKPFGFMPFYPGPGLGGHCIPIDPHYLSWKARQYDFHMKFIELAADVNANMPYYVVSRVMEALNERGLPTKGSTILLVGAAYKPNVADTRESPIYKVIPLLQSAGAEVMYSDPFVPELTVGYGRPERLRSVPMTIESISGVDCVVLLTHHSCLDYDLVLEAAPLVIDTRNALRNANGHLGKVVRL